MRAPTLDEARTLMYALCARENESLTVRAVGIMADLLTEDQPATGPTLREVTPDAAPFDEALAAAEDDALADVEVPEVPVPAARWRAHLEVFRAALDVLEEWRHHRPLGVALQRLRAVTDEIEEPV